MTDGELIGALFKDLEDRGWSWDDGALYAPLRTIWLTEDMLLDWDLGDFHERMTGRVERIARNAEGLPEGDDMTVIQEAIRDTQQLVEVLAEILVT